MVLGHVERGTKLTIFLEPKHSEKGNEYVAVFRYLESDNQLIIHCKELYDIYDTLDWNTRLGISFRAGPYTHTFTGRLMEKQRADMVMVEQISDIETINRRHFERDEIRFNVQIYGLPESRLSESRYRLPENQPEMTEVTYDVSAGGMCIISDKVLKSEHDPYYLLEFSVSDRDSFLLPAKLVRRSNSQHTRLGRYDYGFEIIYDRFPEEKGRLTKSILGRKLATANR